MKLPISRSRDSIWHWLLWGMGTYFALELGPFLIVSWALRKTAGELAGLYLLFAAPAAIILPLIWWLRKWEERGVPPQRVALGWGLSVALCDIVGMVALFCAGVELHFIDRSDAVGGLIVAVLLSVPILYFVMYYSSLRFIASRSAGQRDRDRQK